MRANDPLFTPPEDSFGYGWDDRSSQNRHTPASRRERLESHLSTNHASGSMQNSSKTDIEYQRGRYCVSPPCCKAEEPRNAPYYDHRDVSPLRSDSRHHNSNTRIHSHSKDDQSGISAMASTRNHSGFGEASSRRAQGSPNSGHGVSDRHGVQCQVEARHDKAHYGNMMASERQQYH